MIASIFAPSERLARHPLMANHGMRMSAAIGVRSVATALAVTLGATSGFAQTFCADESRYWPKPEGDCGSAMRLQGNSVGLCVSSNGNREQPLNLAACWRAGWRWSSLAAAQESPGAPQTTSSASTTGKQSSDPAVPAANPLVASIQALLSALGFAPGPADGVSGPQTAVSPIDAWKAAIAFASVQVGCLK